MSDAQSDSVKNIAEKSSTTQNQEQNEPDSNKSVDDTKNKKYKGQSNWSRFLKPWTWKRKKKSEKFVSVATTLERKISVRSTKEDLIRRGVLTDTNGPANAVSQKERGVQHAGERSSRYVSNEGSGDKGGSERLPSTNIDQLQTASMSNNSGGGDMKHKTSEHNSSLKRSTPVYVHHQKYPSDEVTRMSRNMIRQARLNPNRHSYQMATTSGFLSNESPDSGVHRQKPTLNHMQPEPQQPHHHSKPIGLQAVPQAISKSGYSVVSQPPPASRNKQYRNNQPSKNSVQTDCERLQDTRPTSAYDPNRSRSTDVKFAVDSNVSTSKSQDRSSWKFPDTPNTYQVSDSREDSSNQGVQHHRPPHAAKRAQFQSVGNQRGVPPKPPPKPYKSNQHVKYSSSPSEQQQPPTPPPQSNKPTNHHQPGVRAQQPTTTNGIVFAGSAEIIQRTTKINIPPYILEKFSAAASSKQGGGCSEVIASGSGERPHDTSDSDSDSLGPVLYRDGDDDSNHNTHDHNDDEEEEEVAPGGLAAKVSRRDTLALRLATQSDSNSSLSPTPPHVAKELVCAQKSEAEKSAIRSNLTRRLSQRPTKSELEQRNILPQDSAEDRHKEREKVKRQLSRKLSMRPTVKELVERKVLINWHEYVEVYEVQNYDRRGDKPWTRLTPADKASIRKELNEFKKNEMEVHEQSRHYTRYHKP